jgi:dihydrofolate reductase
MPGVVYNTATAFNGFIADEQNSLAWLFAVDPGDLPPFSDFLEGVGTLVMGSTTYEWFLREEGLLTEPERWAGFYGDRPSFVFTTRELPVPRGADIRFESGGVDDAFPRIVEAAGGKDVWVVGGGDLAGQFFDAGLLTEIQLSVAPVALSGGAPVLPRTVGSDRLELRSTTQYGQFAHLVYTVKSVGA